MRFAALTYIVLWHSFEKARCCGRVYTDRKFNWAKSMIEPVKMADFFATFFSAASVILFGALYSLLFAYFRIRKMPRLMPLAYLAYAALFASVLVLASVANLLGSLFWMLVVMLMLVGYLTAPHVVWHLCVHTHAETVHEDAASESAALSSVPLDFSRTGSLYQPDREKAS